MTVLPSQRFPLRRVVFALRRPNNRADCFSRHITEHAVTISSEARFYVTSCQQRSTGKLDQVVETEFFGSFQSDVPSAGLRWQKCGSGELLKMAVSASLDDIDLDVMLDGKEAYGYMEQWLDGHPDFVQAYITKKAKQVGLIGHTPGISEQQPPLPSQNLRQQSQKTPQMTGGSRCACTEVPAPCPDGCSPDTSTMKCTFLNSDLPRPTTAPCEALLRESQNSLDERDLMYELVTDICRGLDVTILCYKILQNVSVLLHAARCSLFLLCGQADSPGRCLISKLFDVSGQTSLEDCSGTQHEIRLPWGMGVAGYVAKTGESVNVPDAYMVSLVILLALVVVVKVKMLEGHAILTCNSHVSVFAFSTLGCCLSESVG